MRRPIRGGILPKEWRIQTSIPQTDELGRNRYRLAWLRHKNLGAKANGTR
jgi:hypothetical protein